MALRIVQSKSNASVKELRAVLRHPGKGPSNLVGLEGTHLIVEALRSGAALHSLFLAQGHEHLLDQPPFSELPPSASTEILVLPRELLNAALTTETPQPIAALAHAPTWQWSDLHPPATTAPLIVALAGIQDPGNLGTVLRSAEAFAANGILSLPGTVTPWNAKAMRASAGSVFRLPFLNASESTAFELLHAAGVATLAAMAPTAAHASQALGAIDLTRPTALFIGSEGSGLPAELAARCDARITIPCPGPVESLNAAVAASILLYETARQRSLIASNARRRPA